MGKNLVRIIEAKDRDDPPRKPAVDSQKKRNRDEFEGANGGASVEYGGRAYKKIKGNDGEMK
jgi:hypothetical protein